jgi:hypothetical protein
MGERVLAVSSDGDARIRAYAHCSAARAHLPSGSVSVLLLNDDTRGAATASLPSWAEGPVQLYRVTARSLAATKVQLNGATLEFESGVPELAPDTLAQLPDGRLTLPAASYAFAVFPNARAAACQ